MIVEHAIYNVFFKAVNSITDITVPKDDNLNYATRKRLKLSWRSAGFRPLSNPPLPFLPS